MLISPAFKSPLTQAGLTTSARIIHYFSGTQPVPSGVSVKPAVLHATDLDLDVFYKQYEYARASWRYFARSSKPRREFASYKAFEEIGIACATCIVCGEQRDWLGRLKRAFIATRTIPEALTLSDFVRRHCPARDTPSARALRASLLRQLAAMTHRAHQAGFFHNDLYWRNILVTWQVPAAPVLWWIDCPRGRFDRWSPLRRHRRIKDLASLDKTAASTCTRPERLSFMNHYLGKQQLDPDDKRLVLAVLSYRAQRWASAKSSASTDV